MSKAYRTVEAWPNAQTLVKPRELVDLVEVTPLTLADRCIYNQLLENAWDAIEKPMTHVIAKSDLRGSHNSNDGVGTLIERVQLLGGNVVTARRHGLLEYDIPQRLRRIIKDSTVFARFQREVMFALTSKYALTLYEMVQKRGNLRWRSSRHTRRITLFRD
ncbi:MAG: RepB family plasmid replication initiator protein [Sulfitobacter sp.]